MSAKILVRVPHVSWRAGRPRFEPGPGLRKLGYKGRDLRHANGAWFSLGEASAFSQALMAEIAERRAAPRARKAAAPARPSVADAPRLMTVEGLTEAWLAHPRMQPRVAAGGRGRAAATLRSYVGFLRVLREEAPLVWTSAAAALDRQICFNLYERLVEARGLASANAVMRTLSAALSFGMNRGWVTLVSNPCSRLKLEGLKPRLRIAEREEIAHLVAAADALGRPEIGDAIMLGVWTGQRQADRLAMADEGLLNGRRVLRQQKTGALLAIPESQQLAARLASMRERRKAHRVSWREIIINERDERPFKADHYRKIFAAIVTCAVHGVRRSADGLALAAPGEARRTAEKYLPALRGGAPGHNGGPPLEDAGWLVAPMASLAGFRDQDLRDTAVTWLALAGCTLPEIAAVTGHELASITTILKHYLARHPELADHAVAKLEQWHG